MLRVAKGNEDMATDDIMVKVAKLHQMVEEFKLQKQSIIDFAEEAGLWHLELDIDLQYTNVQDDHERWLASSHTC